MKHLYGFLIEAFQNEKLRVLKTAVEQRAISPFGYFISPTPGG
jgi:hypothetical protein